MTRRIILAKPTGRLLRGLALALALMLLFAGVVLAWRNPSPLFTFYARVLGRQPASTLQGEQAITHGDTTIRLVEMVPSTTHTVVELVIEDPAITGSTEYLDRVIDAFWPGDVVLTGFAGDEILEVSVRVSPGSQHYVLELPPLLEFDAPASIEILHLRRLTHDPENPFVLQPGPWRFEFRPQVPVAQRFHERWRLDQSVQRGDTTIALQASEFSATETLIFYRLEGPQDAIREAIGAPELHYRREVLKGREKSVAGEGQFVVSFPALPPHVDTFEVIFGPFFCAVEESVRVTLDLPPLEVVAPVGEAPSLELDQVIQAGGASFRFISLTLRGSDFELAYEPADVASEKYVLAGPAATITAIDDLGNVYPSMGQGTEFDMAGEVTLERDSLVLSGVLPSDAKQLTIEVDKMGVISEGPFEFIVSRPR